MNGAMLAFVGDAYFDLRIREVLIRSGVSKSGRFHRQTVFYVSAKAQASVLERMVAEEFLSSEEFDVVRRGRNVKSNTVPKNTDVATYAKSTAFEALIGFLYLSERWERLDEIVTRSMEIRDNGAKGEKR